MNTYDAKHLRLLKLIAAGDWHSIAITDLEELRTLSVCGYIEVSSSRSDSHNITLLAEGLNYLGHLLKLEVMGSAGASQSSPVFQPLASSIRAINQPSEAPAPHPAKRGG